MPDYPVAKKVPTKRTHHGDTFVDDYEWLRDKESADTLAYLEAENDYVKARTAHLDRLRETLFDEIKARTKETDLSVPTRIGRFWYYGRSVEGKQYGISCRCPVAGPDDWSPPQLDAEVEVPDEAADNHGAVVSQAAHECPTGPGGVHGQCVSEVARDHDQDGTPDHGPGSPNHPGGGRGRGGGEGEG